MTQAKFLNLSDYSTKYRVSISTLRRRIKEEQAEYIFENGKYWLRDLPLNEHQVHLTPDPVERDGHELPSAPPKVAISSHSTGESHHAVSHPLIQELPLNQGVDSLLNVVESKAAIQQLIQELKKAYAVILQEKEEHILLLKEEIVDLKTLVHVLEDQNGRLAKSLAEKEQKAAEMAADWAFSLDR